MGIFSTYTDSCFCLSCATTFTNLPTPKPPPRRWLGRRKDSAPSGAKSVIAFCFSIEKRELMIRL